MFNNTPPNRKGCLELYRCNHDYAGADPRATPKLPHAGCPSQFYPLITAHKRAMNFPDSWKNIYTYGTNVAIVSHFGIRHTFASNLYCTVVFTRHRHYTFEYGTLAACVRGQHFILVPVSSSAVTLYQVENWCIREYSTCLDHL